ncbi:MAG: hypothetical protein N4A46_00605 [Schleiferiaceae bacterium]|jgi:hypothetical protein|nr:hypothetical protein [Schleiferiaceae bacterium]
MKNAILIAIGIILGLVTYHLFFSEKETNKEEYTLDKEFTYSSLQKIPLSDAKSIYKRYINKKVKKSKYSKGRGNGNMNNKDKDRYFDLSASALNDIDSIRKLMNPAQPDSVGMRLFIGIQNNGSESDYILMAANLDSVISTLTSKYYYTIKLDANKSPTCPIECDNRDYEDPF